MFQMAVVINNGATEGRHYMDMNCVDTEIKLKTNRMKVVFLNNFVQKLLVGYLSRLIIIIFNYKTFSSTRLCDDIALNTHLYYSIIELHSINCLRYDDNIMVMDPLCSKFSFML